MITTFLLLSTLAYSPGQNWTKTNTTLQLSMVAVSYFDTMQTRWFLSHAHDAVTLSFECPNHNPKCVYAEHNPLLGKYPGPLKLYAATTLAMGLHFAISYFLPPTYREIWQSVTLVLEVSNDTFNAVNVAGIRLQF